MSEPTHDPDGGLAGAAAPLSFDLAAAWLRHAEGDRAAFLSRFALIAAEALPNHAQIQRVRRGLFRKTDEIVGVCVAFDNETYAMRLKDGRHLATEVEKKVKGVVLSTREVDPHTWMVGLMTHVHERTQKARAMAELLAGL
ncbi:hypothetical protein [Burkholderia pyrrocinia]|uniref:hypothetical protein n=1 Tax=Burkholderia pyrrocinia TaxID=60550 RepID=UPI001BCDB5D2|nr:hypothetical protein [Burkholderia pyrrocinia]QVN23431.1 hypothetical protein JYG32_33685 [Burkholderia pyrrocinia]